MLRASFLFLPGVGPKTEARLWRLGLRDWQAYLEAPPMVGKLARLRRLRPGHARTLERADRALAERDGAWFAERLPDAEHWRALDPFGHGALAVDIETDDRGITVVGVHGPRALVPTPGARDRRRGDRSTRLLVRGEDLTPEAVTEALAPATSLLTFNGAAFDLPALARWGVEVPRVPHVDLLAPLRRAGLRGGLKKVEASAGIVRPDEVRGLSGYDAILLWKQHELGDPEALPRLLLYNACDVESLPLLADLAYERLTKQLLEPIPERRLEAFA